MIVWDSITPRISKNTIDRKKEFRMRAFKVFIFGLLYGWVFKIAFDRIYRENDLEDLRNENLSLKDYVRSLERQLQQASTPAMPAEATLFSPPAPQPIDSPNAIPTKRAPAEPFDVPAETPAVKAPAPPTQMTTPSLGASEGDRDDLKIIKGIGPAIERKLNNAGIYTFAALSALRKTDLENILGSQVKRLQDENDLIAQAKRLAKRK
jgi:predicted flap endonuclease-1-like 5' DNA nuclease